MQQQLSRMLAASTVLVLVGCSSSAESESPAYVVVSGSDGVVLADATGIATVPGLSTSGTYSGPLAVALDGTRTLVKADDSLAVVTPGAAPVVVPCPECAGVAVTGAEVVTTRRNYTPGQGFDIVRFDDDLEPVGSIAAERLAERAANDFPAEDTESPVTLAADADTVTVGYLARSGGARSGPSMIAQYESSTGRLIRSMTVDGILGRSAVSPDGTYLAVGVGGSGGACITEFEPVVVGLRTWVRTEPQPTLPAGGPLESETLREPWFELTDLAWDGDVLHATGEVHDPSPEVICDENPQPWRRVLDPATGTTTDLPTDSRGVRWLGPDCADVFAIAGGTSEPELVRSSQSGRAELGSFRVLGPGRVPPQRCDGGE